MSNLYVYMPFFPTHSTAAVRKGSKEGGWSNSLTILLNTGNEEEEVRKSKLQMVVAHCSQSNQDRSHGRLAECEKNRMSSVTTR